MAEKPDKIILDLETKKTFEEVGGHHNKHLLGVSLVGVYSYNRDQYRGFKENELKQLLDLLKQAELVVGYNSRGFDFSVLQPYYKDFDLNTINHLDIMDDVVNALGHRLKLETIAQATLGHGKSGTGMDAVFYYRSNDWDNLLRYCLDDVKVTREIYEYGLNHGYIWFNNAGRKEKILARWAKDQPFKVPDVLTDALRSGQQLEIEYMDESGNVTQRKIDLQQIMGDKIKAYCHLRQAVRIFDISKIKTAKAIGQMDSWQNTLL